MADRNPSELESFWNGMVEREQKREAVSPGKQVHTDLLWREIGRCIGSQGALKILDAGAGFGRFSLPLAESGHHVVHLDISSQMLNAAREKSIWRGITNMEFVHGSIEDLSRFADNSFDLVLCLDSPLSFCYQTYERALCELVRVTRATLVLCVANRLGMLSEGGVNFDLQHFGTLKTALEVNATGTLVITEELKRLQPTLFPSWHAFEPEEIKRLLNANRCRVERISAPGTLARFVEPELLTGLVANQTAYRTFLDFEEQYDSHSSVLGVGAAGAGGLLVTAIKQVKPNRMPHEGA